MNKWGNWITAGAMMVVSAGPVAAATDAEKCEAAKLKIAGKYSFCRLKAEAKAVKTGDPVDYSKCDSKFGLKWGVAETNGGGMCPTNGDQATQQVELRAKANRTAWELSGQPRFADNGNGTITDRRSGLTWEKKVKLDSTQDVINPQDADNYYPWAGQCSVSFNYCQPTAAAAALCTAQSEDGASGCNECGGGEGTCDTFSTLPTLWMLAVDANMASFGGYTDWRLPTREELISIVDYTVTTYGQMTYAAFHGTSCGASCTDVTNPLCSCTIGGIYLTASSVAPNPVSIWGVTFFGGLVTEWGKSNPGYARLVRGGS
jgi:hypothetical protein